MFNASKSHRPGLGVWRSARTRFRGPGVGIALAASLLASSQRLAAQQDTTVRIDGRWRAYIGCWASYTEAVRGADLCIVPTRDSETVEMISVVHDSITSRTTITASGQRAFRTRADCTGWDSVRWSLDERRLYIRTEYVCPTGLTQVSTGMIAMSGLNSFSRFDNARSEHAGALRMMTYSALAETPGLPDELLSRLPPRDDGETRAARINSTAFVSVADVADAAKALDAVVVETWLSDRGHVYSLTPEAVRTLRDVAVPEGVIDMMLRRSHRELFAMHAEDGLPRHARAKKARAVRLRTASSGPAFTPPERTTRPPPGWSLTSDGWKLDPAFEPPFGVILPPLRVP